MIAIVFMLLPFFGGLPLNSPKYFIGSGCSVTIYLMKYQPKTVQSSNPVNDEDMKL